MKLIRKLLNFIRLEEDRTTFPETFLKELDYQSGKILTFASLITLSWLTYIPIDRTLHPDQPLIIMFRIGFPVVGILLFVSRFCERFRTKHLLMLTLFGAYMEFSTAMLTAVTKGDSAYIGGYLFVLTLLAVAPLRRRSAYIILFISLLIFFGVSLFVGTDFSRPQLFYSVNDIFCTAFIVSCFIYILNDTRLIKWRKSKEAEASQTVIEYQNRVLEQQISIAGELHKSLFPKDIPVMDEAVIAYKCAPMMELGGDFIDIFYDSDKKALGLFICDVSGHGVAGALFSSMVKISLNKWRESLFNPSKTLYNIFEALRGKMGNHFVTAASCCVDLRNGKIIYSSAGHLPLVIVRKNGETELLNSRGRLIAEDVDPNYGETETVLKEGELVVLYTDGVTEGFGGNNIMLGEEYFFQILKSSPGMEPEEVNERIFSELKKIHNSSIFRDDVTILIMKYRGSGQE